MVLLYYYKGNGKNAMKLKKYFVILVFFIIGYFFVSPDVRAATYEDTKKGVLTLQSFPEKIFALGGEWEFYWDKLYVPENFRKGTLEKEVEYVNLPHKSNGYDINGDLLSNTGHATYRIRIGFPEEEVGKTKALYIPSISTAYTLWINGSIKAKNGVVGTSRDSMKPESVPKMVEFTVQSGFTELVIQTSNYYQRKAGIHDLILMGEPDDIYEYQNKKLVFRTIIVTSLVIMGLYHLSLFAFRRNEYSLIFFGLLCLFIAIRSILLEEDLASRIFAFFNWEIDRKLEYLGASLGSLFLTLFTYTQFSKDMSKRIRNYTIFATTLISVCFLVTPAIVFTKFMIHLQGLILIIFVYLLFVYILAFLRKREGSMLNMISMFFLLVAAVNDVSYFNDIVSTMELTSVGMLFFLFTQSMILSKKSAHAFARSERLSGDLMLLNASLEQKVQERTEELDSSNQKLRSVNEKLKEAHQSRSRLISNISHEIGSPLTSIQAYTKGMIDGVIQSEKKYIELVYEKSLYLSQILHDLREMSDMEAKQIKYEMREVDVFKYCHKIYEKYKLDLEKQGVTFLFNANQYEKVHGITVLMDPVRIEQVMVNLLTNAQRFVREDGKIELALLKDSTDFMLIKVIDNGTGIHDEEIDLVFDRFYSSRNDGKEHSGTGLGLAISKEIVEYHKGKIGVESKIGKGSCFYFTLPIYNAGENGKGSG